MRLVEVFPDSAGPAPEGGAIVEVMLTRPALGLVADDFHIAGAAGVGEAAVLSLSDESAGSGMVWRLSVTLPPMEEAFISVALPELAGQVVPPISPGAGLTVRVGTLEIVLCGCLCTGYVPVT